MMHTPSPSHRPRLEYLIAENAEEIVGAVIPVAGEASVHYEPDLPRYIIWLVHSHGLSIQSLVLNDFVSTTCWAGENFGVGHSIFLLDPLRI